MNDIVARAPRDVERPRAQGAGVVVRTPIAFEDVVEEARVAAAPGVDRLLHVPDLEERALLRNVLHRFVNQWFDDGPLQVAGVLELVEEPVVVASIEAVIDAQAIECVGLLAQDGGGLRVQVASGEDDLKIAEGEPPAASHERGVAAFVLVEHMPDTLRAFQVNLDLGGDEAGGDAKDDLAGFLVEGL